MKFKGYFVCLLAILLLTASAEVLAQSGPKNIILMIGDGMGISQVTAGRTYKKSLELEKFRNLGLVVTHAYGKDYVTDSAAGATAYSTGVSTYNGAIGVGPDTLGRETILEVASRLGKSTGIVTVCSITHATPASFVAHVASRSKQLEIAEQIAAANTDLYLGSGWGWFLPKEMGGRRPDGEDLLAAMQGKGYTVVKTESEFQSLRDMDAQKAIGLFAENHVDSAQARKPSLREQVAYALPFLARNDKGFFLLVEGSQIDWASHDNKSDQTIIEMADFDDAIGEAIRFSEQNPGTLVVVTADHETGGYALVDGSLQERSVEGKFVTDHHTAVMVPLFAMGPGSESLTGIRTNSEIGRILMEMIR